MAGNKEKKESVERNNRLRPEKAYAFTISEKKKFH